MGTKKKLSAPTLDLHGQTVDQVFDLVDRFISKNQNKERLRIMPGKGTGKVKSELIRYLKLGGYPWEYEVLDNGSQNTGCLVIFLE
jgi:dsDNA-specific endonuclease/ATPase MutS2